jgi:methionine--tRNA ligase beta chain
MKKPQINFNDLMKIDIRIGEIISAKNAEGSNKLIELTVNLGEEYGVVTIFTGMQKFYQPDDFLGKKMLFIANLEPKKMMNKESTGMILAIDNPEKPILVTINDGVVPGSVVI